MCASSLLHPAHLVAIAAPEALPNVTNHTRIVKLFHYLEQCTSNLSDENRNTAHCSQPHLSLLLNPTCGLFRRVRVSQTLSISACTSFSIACKNKPVRNILGTSYGRERSVYLRMLQSRLVVSAVRVAVWRGLARRGPYGRARGGARRRDSAIAPVRLRRCWQPRTRPRLPVRTPVCKAPTSDRSSSSVGSPCRSSRPPS